MKELIKKLKEDYNEVMEMQGGLITTQPLDGGSLEQTRAIVIDSAFAVALNNLQGAIVQLEILNSQLY